MDAIIKNATTGRVAIGYFSLSNKAYLPLLEASSFDGSAEVKLLTD
jgi:hypothetical protein